MKYVWQISLVIFILLNIYYFRTFEYLTSLHAYGFLPILSVISYLLSKFFMSFNISRAKKNSLISTYLFLGIIRPLTFYVTDLMLVAKKLVRAQRSDIKNIFNHRFYELFFLMLLIKLSSIKSVFLDYVFYASLCYFILIGLVLVIKKSLDFDIRVIVLSFLTLFFEVLSFEIMSYEYQSYFDGLNYFKTFEPMIENELRLGIFSHFALGIIILSLFREKE